MTGSKYLLQVNDSKVLIDCGMFQGARSLRKKNWEPLPFDAADVDAVLLTHTHIDHIGYLPRLVKCGFSGNVYGTPPTIEIAKILLIDAANIQVEDADYRNRKKLTRYEKALPLYDVENAEAVFLLFQPIGYGQWTKISDEIRFRYHIVGHILGAASIEIEMDDGNGKKSILFSGDIGRYGNPLTIHPHDPPETDYLVCESTYGENMHLPQDPYFLFEQLLSDAIEKKSTLLIPAFAVGRTQQVTFLVNNLIRHKRISPIDIHIDSPMAVKVTDIYRKYENYHSLGPESLGDGDCCLYGKNVTLHRKRKSSKTLNKLKGPAIILSASGMMTGGRIMHHLINRLPDPSTTLVLVGYLPPGTLGHKIQAGDKTVYIHKQPVKVNSEHVQVGGLSGHADYQEILHWLEPFKAAPRQVFVTHGEQSRSEAMAEHLKTERGWQCTVPELGDQVEL
ncbi:MAG: MBL fold metallo-hydrolase RNA specificity domain-containing protein [Candidatus Zixiibacteriota bacterium]